MDSKNETSTSLRVAILGVAHMHVGSYTSILKSRSDIEIIGFWDSSPSRSEEFAQKTQIQQYNHREELLEKSDIAIVCAANADHCEIVCNSAPYVQGILCEKPIATTLEDADRMIAACEKNHTILMTGFPCRFSPAYQKAKLRIKNGEIGTIIALNCTNRGTCPFDWFVDNAQSGGGAMIDHVVHVADVIQDLLGEEPVKVTAQIGNEIYRESWEDCAHLMLEYPSGIFASLDSSWSRPKGYKTWGDVTMRIIGDKGFIEIDMFGQELDFYQTDRPLTVRGYGSNLDEAMVCEFLSAVREHRPPKVTGEDGRKALRVALMGYASLNEPNKKQLLVG